MAINQLLITNLLVKYNLLLTNFCDIAVPTINHTAMFWHCNHVNETGSYFVDPLCAHMSMDA